MDWDAEDILRDHEEEADPSVAVEEAEIDEDHALTEQYIYGLLAGMAYVPPTPDAEAEMHGAQGDLLAEIGLVERAIQDYRQAAELGKRAKWRRRVADSYLTMNLPRHAFRAYKEAIRLDPRDPESHFHMAEFLRTMGRTYLAIEEFREALRLAPDRAYYALRLGEAGLALNMLDDAVRALRRATRQDPRDAYYRFRLANAFIRAGALNDAIHQLEYAVRLAPCDDYYHALLAMGYRTVSRHDDSAHVLRRTIEIRPKNRAYHFLASEAYRDLGITTLAEHHGRLAGRLDGYDADYVDRLRNRFLSDREEWSRPAWL